MRFGVLALMLVAGCRDVLGIEPLDPVALTDAAPDTPVVVDACGEFDTDLDGAKDECDPCPHLANMNVDTDGDGVGDACDPNPATGGDKRIVWTTFRSTTISDWMQTGGVWTVTPTGLVQSNAMGSAKITVPTTVHDVYAIAALHVTGTGTDPTVSLCMAGTGNGEVCCEVSQSMDALKTASGAGISSSGGLIDGLSAIVGHVTGTSVHCDIVHSTATAETGTLSRPSPPVGKISLKTTSAAIRFDYLFIAGVP